MTTPLLLTDDDRLAEDVMRLAAAAGVGPARHREPMAALASWLPADLVLVGADVVGEVARLAPPRRPGLHVVAAEPPPHEVFRHAVRIGAEDVTELPASDAWLVEILTDSVDGSGPAGIVVSVLGGSGGVGASVFAAALAGRLGEEGAAMLVDADSCGTGLERILGMERLEGTRWAGVGSVTGRMSGRALRESLPQRRGVGVLGWGAEQRLPLQPFAVREVLSAGRRGHDAVVVDLARQPDPVGQEVLARTDHVVLVCGSSLSAVAAGGRALGRLSGLTARPHLVVRAGGGLAPGEVARALGLTLTGVTQHQRGLEEAIDLGAGPLHSRRGSVARAAGEVAEHLAVAARLVA